MSIVVGIPPLSTPALPAGHHTQIGMSLAPGARGRFSEIRLPTDICPNYNKAEDIQVWHFRLLARSILAPSHMHTYLPTRRSERLLLSPRY
jgi:hypothetical protein